MMPTPRFLISLWLLCLLLAGLPRTPLSAAAPLSGPVIVRGGGGEAGFDSLTGRIVFLRRIGSAATPGIAGSPAEGDLWSLRLRDGRVLRAGDFLKNNPLQIQRDSPQAVRFVYVSTQGATVTVNVTGSVAGIDLRLSATQLPDDALDVALPADLLFNPSTLHRVLFPEHLGIALKPSFFRPHASAQFWDSVSIGPDGLRRAAGTEVQMDSLDAPAIPVTATDMGKQWLGAELTGRWEAMPQAVNRPPLNTPEVDLLSSAAGPSSAASVSGRACSCGLAAVFRPVKGRWRSRRRSRSR